MIDICTEPLIRLTDAARLAGPGRGNRPRHLSTILRWILDGVKTPSGFIKLEAVRIGSKWMTSAQAVQRFVEALTPTTNEGPAPSRSPTARKLASDSAKRQLEQLGI